MWVVDFVCFAGWCCGYCGGLFVGLFCEYCGCCRIDCILLVWWVGI